MLADILITVLLIASTFYMTLVLLRFLLQLARADFYNPISQFVVKATNPLLRPLRRVIPGWGGIDGAALVLAVLVQALTLFLIIVLLTGAIPGINPIKLVVWAVLNIMDLVIKIYFAALIVTVVVSWIAPHSGHPGIQLVAQIIEPVARPVRNLIPPMGGLDLSPIVIFLILQVLTAVVDHMKLVTGLSKLTQELGTLAGGLGSIGLGM
ncbi:YggT family protein [Marinobacter sp. C2H3]|uniref:YggT family protein n=1 Tax=Marinobacter sp. C2H3 TaxID=3119003 RepID=UPI00300F470F